MARHRQGRDDEPGLQAPLPPSPNVLLQLMIRFIITCLITVSAIAHAADTYVAKPGDFSPPNPMISDPVTWKPGTPDAVIGLTFGINAFTSIIDASSAAGAGDTVFIASGIYAEGSEISPMVALNFKGDGPGLTILDGNESHSLFALSSSSTIADLTIQNGSGSFGAGGISSIGPELNLSNIHFLNNSLALAVLFTEEVPSVPHVVRIEGCLFSNNASVEGNPSCTYHEGDGLESSDLIISNTTFSSNQGLAIRSLAGTLTLTQCTFYNNPSGAFDASDEPDVAAGSSVTLNNSLVLDSFNAPLPPATSNGTNFLADGPITTGDLSYSNTTASIPSDLIDIVLSDNGGATATHKLAANSVAIDAGTNADAVDADNNPLANDQRGSGFPRISQGTVDIGAFEVLAPTLTLSIADLSISEDGGSTSVTVSRNTDTTNALTVNLSSDDVSEATLPTTLTIPAGGVSATVTLTAVGDAIVDGPQTVTISATVSGFTGGSGTVDVTDDDVPTLALSIADPSISENGGTTTVTVTRNTDTEVDLTVGLSSDDETAATVPAIVTILAGQASATFTLTAVDDAILDDTQTVTATATSSGFVDGADTLDILDDEAPTLTLSFLASSISENGGSTIVTVSRNTDTTNALTVSLSSDDTSESTLPTTLAIPAGDVSATVTLTAVDDAIVDGTQTVTISADADGFTGDSEQLDVTDDDVPTLILSIADPSISENGGSSSVTVSRNTNTTSALTVNLLSNDTSEATVPATLIIPIGQVSASVTLTAVDDAIFDGPQTVTISADATNFTGDSGQLNVTSDDVLQITLIGGGTLSEPDSFSRSPLSPSAIDLVLQRNGTFGNVVVNIGIAPGSQAEIGNDFTINGATSSTSSTSSTFQVTIPDGESEVAIPVQAIDDIAAEVDETFVVLLLPGSFVSGNTSVSVSIAQNDYGVISLEDFDSSADPNGGEGTLRQAITNAKAGLTIADVPPSDPVIIFQPDLLGEIKLMAGAFQLDQSSFSIIGPGSQQVSISGEGASRIFFVSDPAQDLTYSISGLTMTDGFSTTNGGAIFNTESLFLSDCVLSECAANIGGAIANEGSLELDSCTLSKNAAIVYGGAVDNFFGLLSLRDCTLAENHAEFGGGIENSSGSELWVDSSTFFLNSAGASGGAIDSFDAITNISNTTISGNQAGFGGGIFNERSAVSIWQSTIVENIALTSVGGILTSGTMPVSTTLHNTIVAGNTESDSPSDLSTDNPSFADVNELSSNNLIGDSNSAGGLSNGINGNIVGTGATNVYRPLADNGGSTATHSLLPGSLVINAGNPAFALDSEGLPLTTDQRGFPRFTFGTNDIGAFEVSENPISIVSVDANPGVSVTIIWTSEAGVSYDVLRSTDLSTWTTVANGVTAMSGLTSWTDNDPPLDRAFYIVRYSTAE